MIDLINLSDWKKQKEIILELHREYGINISKDGREWREAVEKWNKKFASGDVPFFVTHSNSKGFKATINYQEAKIARNDYMKRAFNMLRKARECDMAFGNLHNFKMDFEKGELV